MLITNKHLEGACQNQIDLFNKTFPVGVEFNTTNWDLALAVGLQVMWMKRFLDESNRKIYVEATASALKIFDEVKDSALKIYKEATASASKIYDEATIRARKIYDEAIEPAWKIYDEATASALEKYEEARAPAWKICYETTASAWKTYHEATASALFNALEQQFNAGKKLPRNLIT